ncbi:Major facilitator super domain-containing protein 12 [Schistosoma haematobium]|uniref:Major facilitator super domain-containing protein 12 n=1 Tax=Schistosoma haematobium TaxID=6185 RepID=A0A922LKM1_SCHHA|nr:Major facilitator super domain-containing protein 12 [Schistosoma haematobium]KAH9587985.1 Major facilitator super domain-containing protein 12 [Schistosoma haematobium]
MNDIKVSQSLSVIQATTTNKMKWISKIAYGTGQMLKDLVLGFICIFYIIFYEGCISLSSSQVGALLLCGQIANGLATPLIGYLSDRPLGLTEKPTTVHQSITCEDGSVKKDKRLFNRMKRQLRLGQRKSWHLGGCLLMLIAFPLMFGQPEYFVGLPIVVKLLINGMFMICVQPTYYNAKNTTGTNITVLGEMQLPLTLGDKTNAGICYISGNCYTTILGIDWIDKFDFWCLPLSTPKVEAQPWPETNKSWVRVHLDYAGPINGQYFLVVVVDSYSKWPEIYAV